MSDVPAFAQIDARLSGDHHSFRCAFTSTILDAAIDAGLLVPHSCRQGHCGACISTLVEGTVVSTPGSALSRRDRLRGRVLACQSRPTSAYVRLDYDS